jgi:energy-coupling factor transporter ATP-binding protein EcfA2
MIGYIGANGAGKSTTIKMPTGILTPTSGEISCNGFPPGVRPRVLGCPPGGGRDRDAHPLPLEDRRRALPLDGELRKIPAVILRSGATKNLLA